MPTDHADDDAPATTTSHREEEEEAGEVRLPASIAAPSADADDGDAPAGVDDDDAVRIRGGGAKESAASKTEGGGSRIRDEPSRDDRGVVAAATSLPSSAAGEDGSDEDFDDGIEPRTTAGSGGDEAIVTDNDQEEGAGEDGDDDGENDDSSVDGEASADDSLEVQPVDNKALLSAIAVGSRLEVYWPADGEYHPCVVADRDSAGAVHALLYDDSMVEEVDLTWEVFRLREGAPAAQAPPPGAAPLSERVSSDDPPSSPYESEDAETPMGAASMLSPIAEGGEDEKGGDEEGGRSSSFSDGYREFLHIIGDGGGSSHEPSSTEDEEGGGWTSTETEGEDTDEESRHDIVDLRPPATVAFGSGSDAGAGAPVGHDDDAAELLVQFPALADHGSNGDEREEDGVEAGDAGEEAIVTANDQEEEEYGENDNGDGDALANITGEVEQVDDETLLSQVTVGSRLEVYWLADEQYHPCVVADRHPMGAIHTLRYDDGVVERIDLTWEIFRLRDADDDSPPATGAIAAAASAGAIEDEDALAGTRPAASLASTGAEDDSPETIDNEALLSVVVVGSRLEVYWPADEEYHACVITNRDPMGDIHTLRYDDGTAERTDLTWEIFRLRDEDDRSQLAVGDSGNASSQTMPASSRAEEDSSQTIDNEALLSQVTSGSRLEVYWPADEEYHACIVTNHDPMGAIYTLRYDEGVLETIDLTWEIFRLLDEEEVRTAGTDTPGIAQGIIAVAPAGDIEEGDAAGGTRPSDVDDEGNEDDNDNSSDAASPAVLRSPRAEDDSPETIDNEALLSAVVVGSRLEVYWPSDKKYHACIVAGHDPMGTIHTLQYDEGVVETIDLTWEVFRLCVNEDDTQLAIGAIVSPSGAQDVIAAAQAGDIEEGAAADTGLSEVDERGEGNDNGEDDNNNDSGSDAAPADDTEDGAVVVRTRPSDFIDEYRNNNDDGVNAVLAGDIEEGGADAGTQPSGVDNRGDEDNNNNNVEDDDNAAHVGPDDVGEEVVPDDIDRELGHLLPPRDIRSLQNSLVEEGVGDGVRDDSPWWQQNRTKALLDILAIVVVIVVVILAARLPNQSNRESNTAPSSQPSSSANPTPSPTIAIW